MRGARRSSLAGMTLIELLIVGALFIAIAAKGAFVVSSALELANDETASMHYEDQARVVMDRIAIAVMASDRGTLMPSAEEVHTDSIQYSSFLGLEDGEPVWSDPQSICLEDGSKVAWCQNPGEPDERKVLWTSLVAPMLQGEEINGVDDNGNGLIDEDGLSFVLDGERVTIRLTLKRPEVDGHLVEETQELVVHCRN